jgi:hypothetical protein
VVRGLDLGICLEDLSLFVDQVGDSLGISRFGVVARAESETELTVSVAQQRERKAELFCEGGIRRNVVEARTDDLDLLLGELSGSVPEPFTFDRSAGGVCLGIEPKEDFPTAEVPERDRLPFMAGDREIGRGLAGIEHRYTSAVDYREF